MRKTMMLVAVAALMVALVAGSAAAKQNGKNMATYNFKGTLAEVASDGSSVSVNVTDGNGRGREVAEAYALEHPNEPMVFPTPETKVEIDDAPASPKGSACSRSISQPSAMSAPRRWPMTATQSSISPSSRTVQNASSQPCAFRSTPSSTASSPEASFGCRLRCNR